MKMDFRELCLFIGENRIELAQNWMQCQFHNGWMTCQLLKEHPSGKLVHAVPQNAHKWPA
jgi:hypothetical protein